MHYVLGRRLDWRFPVDSFLRGRTRPPQATREKLGWWNLFLDHQRRDPWYRLQPIRVNFYSWIGGNLSPCAFHAEFAGISAPGCFVLLFAIETTFWKLLPKYFRTNFPNYWKHESSPENIHASNLMMGKYFFEYFPIRLVLRYFPRSAMRKNQDFSWSTKAFSNLILELSPVSIGLLNSQRKSF